MKGNELGCLRQQFNRLPGQIWRKHWQEWCSAQTCSARNWFIMNARGLRPPLEYSIFSYKAPTATAVLLAGDFTRWLKQPIAMHPEADGVWKTTVALPPGTYHYRFLVDGEWHADPECKVRVKNPFGSE